MLLATRQQSLVQPAGVLLDVGGTLLVEEKTDLAGGVRALRADPRFAASVAAPRPRDLILQLSKGIDRVHRTNARDFTVRGWLRSLLPAASQQDITELDVILWRATISTRAMQGVHAALAALRQSGIRAGAVSNTVFSADAVTADLARHGILPFLDFVLSSAELGVRKPDTAIFRAACARLGAPPARTWFIGDSREKDITGAAAAGLVPIWFAPATIAAPAGVLPAGTMRITDWPAFATIVQALPPTP